MRRLPIHSEAERLRLSRRRSVSHQPQIPSVATALRAQVRALGPQQQRTRSVAALGRLGQQHLGCRQLLGHLVLLVVLKRAPLAVAQPAQRARQRRHLAAGARRLRSVNRHSLALERRRLLLEVLPPRPAHPLVVAVLQLPRSAVVAQVPRSVTVEEVSGLRLATEVEVLVLQAQPPRTRLALQARVLQPVLGLREDSAQDPRHPVERHSALARQRQVRRYQQHRPSVADPVDLACRSHLRPLLVVLLARRPARRLRLVGLVDQAPPLQQLIHQTRLQTRLRRRQPRQHTPRQLKTPGFATMLGTRSSSSNRSSA
jgi:hypothetical protein